MDDRLKMIEELMKHPLGSDDEFKFRCKQCGGCCRDRNDILLSPFDLCRMAKALDKTLPEVLSDYGHLYVGDMSKVPLISLRMRDDNGKCHFLREDNRCRIHSSKPVVCALFPLGRSASRKDGETEIYYILQPTGCGDRDEIHTPREWMGEFDLEESEEWFFIWQDIVFEISEHTRKLLPKLPESVVNEMMIGMANILYMRYHLDKPLPPQVKENGILALKMLKMIEDMMRRVG